MGFRPLAYWSRNYILELVKSSSDSYLIFEKKLKSIKAGNLNSHLSNILLPLYWVSHLSKVVISIKIVGIKCIVQLDMYISTIT